MSELRKAREAARRVSTRLREIVEERFAKLAAGASVATGSFWAFGVAFLVILGWIAMGPLFQYSMAWQLVVNTGTTIVTFLMVFVIQHAQNRQMRAVQLKLNELVAAVQGASNRLIDVEGNSERELDSLAGRYSQLAEDSVRLAVGTSTSVETDVVAGVLRINRTKA